MAGDVWCEAISFHALRFIEGLFLLITSGLGHGKSFVSFGLCLAGSFHELLNLHLGLLSFILNGAHWIMSLIIVLRCHNISWVAARSAASKESRHCVFVHHAAISFSC